MTPKKRMGKSTMSLARNLKSSGRLNVDDIEKAGKLRKTKPLSEQKNMKKFSKYMKQEMGTKKLAKDATMAAAKMGIAGSMKGIKELMKKVSNAKKRTDLTKAPARRAKPASVISRRRARVKR